MHRRLWLGVSAATVLALALASPASAHYSTQAYVAPNAGPPGTQATVKGYLPTDEAGNPNMYSAGAVEVRWGTKTGPILARARGETFTASVTIPQAPVGAHWIWVVQYKDDGTLAASTAATFEVTAAPASAPAKTVSPAPQQQAPATSAEPVATPRPATRERTSVRSERSRKGARSPASHSPAASQRARGAASLHAGAGARARSLKQAQRSSSTSKESGRHRAKGSRDAGRAAAHHAASKKKPSSLTSRESSQELDRGIGARLAIGIGLLGTSIVALLAGFLVAEVRRRRALADPGSR